jgi:hypothetical protein
MRAQVEGAQTSPRDHVRRNIVSIEIDRPSAETRTLGGIDSDWHNYSATRNRKISLACFEKLLIAGLLLDPCQLQKAIHDDRVL